MDPKDLFTDPRKFVVKIAPFFWAAALIYLTVVIVGSEKSNLEKLESLGGTYLALGLMYAITWFYLKSTEEK